jgi:hypothetical protein
MTTRLQQTRTERCQLVDRFLDLKSRICDIAKPPSPRSKPRMETPAVDFAHAAGAEARQNHVPADLIVGPDRVRYHCEPCAAS